jgi:3-deoxy-manno-octulosonate cytidylyltransferase (CMP-KDO synthetase)
MPDLIVIPARFGSSRLPGKPLIAIAGRTLLERVVRVARNAAALAGDVAVIVATDDARIEAHARDLGCVVAMTSSAITSGSGRAFAAVAGRNAEIIVNLQGDAPFVPPSAIVALITAARTTRAAVTTPVVRLSWEDLDRMRTHKLVSPFSGTTCVRMADGRALWFSKTIIPAIRDEDRLRRTDRLSPIFRHLGLYAYRFDALERFEAAPPSPYEMLEGLEQLRFFELGLGIHTVEISPPSHAMSGIDTPADVAMAEDLIARLGDPYVPCP